MTMIKKKSVQFLLIAAVLAPAITFAETLLFQNVESTGQSQYAVLTASPDGSTLYAINNSATPGVERFSVNSSGTLSSDFAVSTSQAGLEGATSAAFSPDADVLLLGNDSAGARFGLYAFSLGDSGNGFEPLQFANSNGGATEAGLFDDINVTDVAISPDGKNIYVTGTLIGGAAEGVIAVLGGIKYLPNLNRVEYTPFASSVDLRVLETDSTALSALDQPVGIAITTGGAYVISSSNAVDDALVYLLRDGNTGALTFNSIASSATGISELRDPADILVASIDSKDNIFIADKESGTIIQFEQTEISSALALQRIYGKLGDNGQPDVSGLSGVSKLIMNTDRTVLHAAATAASTITSFYVDSGLLIKSPDTTAVTQGLKTTNGVAVAGIGGVDLLALGNGDEFLYAGASISPTVGLAKFTRESNVSLAVTSVRRGRVQPGVVTPFSVVLTNNGPADAPGFLLRITPSHAVTDVTVDAANADLGTCVLTSEANARSILCKGALLANGATFGVEVSMRPTRVTTASVSALAGSGNHAASSIVRASDSIAVGETKNGTLSMGLLAHLLLLLMYVARRSKAPH